MHKAIKILQNARKHVTDVQQRLTSGQARDPHQAGNMVMILERLKLYFQDIQLETGKIKGHSNDFHQLVAQFGRCSELFRDVAEGDTGKEGLLIKEWTALHEMGERLIPRKPE